MIYQHPYGAPARPRDTGAVWEEPYRPVRDMIGTGLGLIAFCALVWGAAGMFG